MSIPQSWVTEVVRDPENIVDPSWSVTPDESDEGFIRVGSETERHEPLGKIEGLLVFGRVDHTEEFEGFKKPIRFCQVNAGDANGAGGLQEIICGARNSEEGPIVVVALPGRVLSGDFEISARKIYGKISNGMLCSEAELGMTDFSADILTLPSVPVELGSCAREFIGLDEEKFEVNITLGRGHTLSARDLGCEICSALNLDFTDPAKVKELPVEGEILDVTIDEDTDTRRFSLHRVTGINPSVETPWRIRRRLLLAGQRPVNVAMDVTNYVMLLLGQPMHAFDGPKIAGGLHIHSAKAGETLMTLDRVDRKLDPADVVICNDSDIRSPAGIVGGPTSEIADDTTDAVLEAADWSPLHVFRNGHYHKLSSEASRRSEHGVDTALVGPALDSACQLLAGIAGGTIDTGHTLLGEVVTMPTIDFAVSRVSEIADVDYPRETAIGRLHKVGCKVVDNGNRLAATPPTWRSDLIMSADLAEEILRLKGLKDILIILPIVSAGRDLTRRQLRRRFVGRALAHNGYPEILPTPFITNDVFDVWDLDADDPCRNTIRVINPLESDHAQPGTTLLSFVLKSLKCNVARS